MDLKNVTGLPKAEVAAEVARSESSLSTNSLATAGERTTLTEKNGNFQGRDVAQLLDLPRSALSKIIAYAANREFNQALPPVAKTCKTFYTLYSGTVQAVNLSLMPKGTSEGLIKHLQNTLSCFPNKRSLKLSDSLYLYTTDALLLEIVPFKAIPALESLDLAGCSHLTDAGLAHLKGLTSLQSLELAGCERLTDAGKANLKTHLPNLNIQDSTNASPK